MGRGVGGFISDFCCCFRLLLKCRCWFWMLRLIWVVFRMWLVGWKWIVMFDVILML